MIDTQHMTVKTTLLVLLSIFGGVGVMVLATIWLGPGEFHWLPAIVPPLMTAMTLSWMAGESRRTAMLRFAAFMTASMGFTYLRFHLTAFGIAVAALGMLAAWISVWFIQRESSVSAGLRR